MQQQILSAIDQNNIQATLQHIREPLYLVKDYQTGQLGALTQTTYLQVEQQLSVLVGVLPALYPEWLGDQNFLAAHNLRFPYIVGEMANGIATAEMVIAAAKTGVLGFFGAAGLMPTVVAANIQKIQTELHAAKLSWGANLIHAPYEPAFEEAIVNLYLQHQVQRVSASAYMKLSPHLVRYACSGLSVDPSGNICRRNYVLAKISRPEVAKQFIAPAPAEILQYLVQTSQITQQEANLAAHISVATDITVEADSGGHTDNRPLTVLFPTIHKLAEEIQTQHRYAIPVRIGAAGGIGTPAAVAAAFGLGASYVLTGSVNQAAVESGLSAEAKQMLMQADIADVIMAPAADMFELGVKLQVLKRGSLFAGRANKLYEIYSRYENLEALPPAEKNQLEKQILGTSIEAIWDSTREYFSSRDPLQLERAQQSPKHRMALVFRWYLGLSSQWAIKGEPTRRADYQIWCGPAMGAFNAWAKGSFLADGAQCSVAQIGLNLLEGAAVITRAQQLRSYGFILPSSAFDYRPRLLS